MGRAGGASACADRDARLSSGGPGLTRRVAWGLSSVRFHEKLLNPVTRALGARGARGARGISPDLLTLLALPPAVAAGVAAGFGWFWLAAGLMLASGVMDLLDGALARLSGRETRFGALLDSTLDRICDACVPVGLVVFFAPALGGWAALPALAMVTGFAISYVRARAQSLQIALPRLWLRREDRFALTLLSLVLAPLGLPGLNIEAPVVFLMQGVLAALGTAATASALLAARRAAG